MKKLTKLITTVFMAPMFIGAYGTAADQEVYIVEGVNSVEYFQYDPLGRELELCNFAYSEGDEPEFPIFTVIYRANIVDLYSIQTQSAQGRVVNDNVRKVGEIISCYGDMTGPPIVPPVYGAAPEFPDGTVSADVNVASRTELNGAVYYGTGSLRIRTVPPSFGPDFAIPYPGFYLLGGTTTLHKLLEGNYLEVIGAATNNIATPLPGYPTSESPKATFIFRIADSGYIVPPISRFGE